MPVLSDLSSDLAAIVDAAGRSVVRVEARRRIPASGIIWSADGTVVTANHVVQREENITVGLPDGSKVGATLAGRDPATDVAVLRLQSAGLTATPRASTEGLRVGHLVLALGRPGRTVRATLGIVSALGESWRTVEGSLIDHYLQTDAPFHPGFSGGPLVDAGGRGMGAGIIWRPDGLIVTNAHVVGQPAPAHVFPDVDLVSVSDALVVAETAGIEARDVEGLREHYARTLRLWVQRLEARRAEAVKLVGEAKYRTWGSVRA